MKGLSRQEQVEHVRVNAAWNDFSDEIGVET